MYRRIAPRSNSKLTPPHFQRRFRTLESSLTLQTIETSRLRNAINRAFNWAGKVWVRRCCGGSWWNRLCCLCLRCDIDLVKNDAIGKCLDGVADWMTDGVENEAGFFFLLFLLVAFISWFAVETPPTVMVLLCLYRREDGIDRSTNSILSHLSPFTIYSLLHHSVCSPTPTAPLTTNSSSPIPGFYSPSLSLFPSFFPLSPPFPYVSFQVCLPPSSMASRRRSTWPGALSGSYEKEDEIFCRIFFYC